MACPVLRKIHLEKFASSVKFANFVPRNFKTERNHEQTSESELRQAGQ